MSLAAAVAVGAATLVSVGSPARAEDVDCQSLSADTAPVVHAEADHLPYAAMHLDEAHAVLERLGVLPGAGVTVAVVDSGVNPVPGIPLAPQRRLPAPPLDGHGTVVAGLVAGADRPGGEPVGVAPGASVVDVRVYDRLRPNPGEVGPSAEGVTAGLEWLAGQPGLADVVAVPVAVAAHERGQAVIDRLWQQGTVVVAASGDRPGQDDPGFEQLGEYTGDEDAAEVMYPAGYDGVVAVSSTGPGASAVVLASSATDVAAPTVGAVSYGLNGSTCVVTEMSTAWATAEVAGVLALLRSAYPRDTPAQLVARLVRTASGRPDVPSRFTGAGTVQPVEALTRPLRPTRKGAVAVSVPEAPDTRAEAPPERQDVLAGTRRSAVWWGLAGGGALLLALILRPVLSRRR